MRNKSRLYGLNVIIEQSEAINKNKNKQLSEQKKKSFRFTSFLDLSS